ncbi:hypothetical protein PACTADRAFT_48198 [Pachysolen tannophilus NRRL Y-2460]|uniref:Thioesterase domain-containing protein n=1 Tax=Pachysolen tannophilus NRRL Y-2460 TaxID=669874 RepID=A0A1E4U351_PACTA|nr:hypothetical protein PACTADRAFT_48198 [Pachysolen tannophilus NRRL Y-2460]
MFKRSVVLGNRLFKLQSRSLSGSGIKNQQQSRRSGWAFAIVSFGLGAAVGSYVPINSLFQFYLNEIPESESDVQLYIDNLEKNLQKLPLVAEFEKNPNYISIRAWENVDNSTILNDKMVSGSLRRPGGFAIKPAIFLNEKEKESVTIIHVGPKLCGFPFLVHGGMLATILDESLKRCSVLSFKEIDEKDFSNFKYDDELSYKNIKMEDLTLHYKFPTLANNFIVVRAKCVDADDGNDVGNENGNGNVKVKGVIETVHGRPLVEGDATFKFIKEQDSWKKWFMIF